MQSPHSKVPDFLTMVNNLIRQTQAAMKDAPPGSLNIKRNKGYVQYYRRIPGTSERYIYIPRSEMELVRILAQKDYDRKALKILKKGALEASRLHAIVQADPSDSFADSSLFSDLYQSLDALYDSLSVERQNLITPAVPTTRQYVKAWLEKPYERMGFRADDNTRYFSKGHGRLRSKSELYIANQLYYGRYPSKYECPLLLGNVLLHPDFTILDTHTRTEKYLEHCGMLGDPDYTDALIRKINTYESNDIFRGETLFLTYETSNLPFDTRSFERLLAHYFRKPLVW